jgi:hypothetical protein
MKAGRTLLLTSKVRSWSLFFLGFGFRFFSFGLGLGFLSRTASACFAHLPILSYPALNCKLADTQDLLGDYILIG